MDKTIFRVYPGREVIALFPRIAASIGGYLCQSYQHVGQHGAVDTNIVVKQTQPATKREYNPLLKELERIGYNPVVVKRCTYRDLRIRMDQTKNWR